MRDLMLLAASMGRAAAEDLMVDRCRIADVVGHDEDLETGEVTAVLADPPAYDGPCRVDAGESYQRNPEVGGSTATVERFELHVPVGSYRPVLGQVAVITAATLDPHMVDRQYRIVALPHETAATAYRLGVELVS